MSHTLHSCYFILWKRISLGSGKGHKAMLSHGQNGQITECKKPTGEFLQASHTLGQR